MEKDYKFLKIWLLTQDKTIKEFADYLKVSRTHLSAVINERVKPGKTLDFLIWQTVDLINKAGWH